MKTQPSKYSMVTRAHEVVGRRHPRTGLGVVLALAGLTGTTISCAAEDNATGNPFGLSAGPTAGVTETSGGSGGGPGGGPGSPPGNGVCGNGTVEAGEKCDGAMITADCRSATMGKLSMGTLRCNATCDGYDTSMCVGCGNGIVEAGEECEGDVEITCESKGLMPGGKVACTECKIDTSGCCGDGKKGGDEACDGMDFGPTDCKAQEKEPGKRFTGGMLGCTADCKLVTDACTWCGDGSINGDEQCEGDDLKGATCVTYKYLGTVDDAGTLGCDPNTCQHDTSGCAAPMCGDQTDPKGDANCPAACTGKCPDAKTCVIDCAGDQKCQGKTVDCPDDMHCQVKCDGTEACQGAKINCPATTGDCDVTCLGEASCANREVNCGDVGKCTVLCDYSKGDNVCWPDTVNCGRNTCKKTCTGDSAWQWGLQCDTNKTCECMNIDC